LIYDAASELLSGSIADKPFREIAFSGGSRGHKANVKSAAATRYLHDNPLNDSYGRLATTREVLAARTLHPGVSEAIEGLV